MSSLFEREKIVVVGDLMLDVYTIGHVQRVSPEAPVLVLRVDEESERPGGAGNAMINLSALGMDVVAVGRVGNDLPGRHLKELLLEEGVDPRGIVTQQGFQTPVKKRMIADNQQLLRVDHEKPELIDDELERELIGLFPGLLEGAKVVAISDYAKGFLSPSLLSAFISMAKERNIPVIVDPKGIDFTKYRGATLIKPNLSEAYAAANLETGHSLESVAARLLQEISIDNLMVTRGKDGISLYSKDGESKNFPVVHVHEVKDVTGAGDTVLAVIAAALANELSLEQGIGLANRAAGLAVERLGCAKISQSDLALPVTF